MATIEEVQAKVANLTAVISEVDTKLDEVRARINELVAGQTVSQEQLDSLNSSLDEAQTAASNVLSETTDLA